MLHFELPPGLKDRLALLPKTLQEHIDRVRPIARLLAKAHSLDIDQADLTAAAHDVARHLPPNFLLEEAERIGLTIRPIEKMHPILLHGPVGAQWLLQEHVVTDLIVLDGIRWHTTAHPDLSPIGQVVFLADKLDPIKIKNYPFQPEVERASFQNLSSGMLTFLNGMFEQRLKRGEMIHPLSNETRNNLLFN